MNESSQWGIGRLNKNSEFVVVVAFGYKYLTVWIVRPRMPPPPVIHPRETTLSSTPSPQLLDRYRPPASSLEGIVQSRGGRSRSPPARITPGMVSASAAPTLVGVAETAPPW